MPDAQLRRTVLTREMDSENLSPLQRLERALKKKAAELGIAEGIAKADKPGFPGVTDERAEAMIEKVIGRRLDY